MSLAVKGGLSATSSYNTAPMDHISDLESYGLSCQTSGDA